MTWAGVGKVTGTVLAAVVVSLVQSILRWTFGVEWMETVYESIVLLAILGWFWWLIWERQP